MFYYFLYIYDEFNLQILQSLHYLHFSSSSTGSSISTPPPIPHFPLLQLKGVTTYLHTTPSTRYQYLLFINAPVS